MDMEKIVRDALSGVAPNMNFRLSFGNPQYFGQIDTARRVVVSYEAADARKHGVTEEIMREAVMTAIPDGAFLRGVGFHKGSSE